MNLKRFFALIAACSILLTMLTGCKPASETNDAKLSVVCTAFAPYNWVREIARSDLDDVSLTFLLGSGVDPHSFQPTAADFVNISTCDLFVYVGGESDAWVSDALNNAANPDMIVINLLDTLKEGLKTEELTQGMEHEHCDEHEGGDCEDEEHTDGHEHADAEYDEHVWLSLRNAKVFCETIADALTTLDAENADKYENNLMDYTKKLSAMDDEYKAAADSATIKTLLFGDRFPFRYLMDDYGLSYYAAFPGCSAETEASFETIVFLSQKADELGLHTIMVTESSNKAIANTIISNTKGKDQRILALDSMQSVTLEKAQSGTSYLSIMQENLSALKQALE